MFGRRQVRKVGHITRRQFLFDLKDERVLNTVSEQQDDIIAGPDATGSYDFKRYVDRLIELQYPLIACRNSLLVRTERFHHLALRPDIHMSQDRWTIMKAMTGAGMNNC